MEIEYFNIDGIFQYNTFEALDIRQFFGNDIMHVLNFFLSYDKCTLILKLYRRKLFTLIENCIYVLN